MQKIIAPPPKPLPDDEAAFDAENLDAVEMEVPVIEEENQVATKVTLPSRKLKIKISNELLVELEKMNVKFSLN